MKKASLTIFFGGFLFLLALFSGCGDRSGEKEFNQAMKLAESGDLVRAQGQLEKAVRKLSDRERKAIAENELGIVLWKLGKKDQALESFSESCSLSGEITGANENLAIALCQAGRLDEAEFELTKILNEQPKNPTALLYLGIVQMERRNWAGAAKEIAKEVRANPKSPAAQNALALAELHQRQAETAIQRLKQLLAASPGYAPAAYNLAAIYDQWMHNSAAAIGWYRQYLEKSGGQGAFADRARQAIARLGGGGKPSSPTAKAGADKTERAARYVSEGVKLYSAKKYDEAADRCRRAVALDPASKRAQYNLGLCLYALGNYAPAARAFDAAVKIDPRFADARYMLALTLAKQTKWDDAEREAKALKQLDPTRGKSLLEYISKVRK